MSPSDVLTRPAPSPASLAARGPERTAAEAATESVVAALWSDVLRAPAAAADEDFFDAGGDSLGLLTLLAAIETRFGRRLPAAILGARITIAGLTRAVMDRREPPDTSGIVALQPDGDLPPFFCVHGRSGVILHLQLLARHMGTRRPFLAPRCPPGAAPPTTIEEIARSYVAEVVARQPEGAIALGGYSLGCAIAFEMARQLRAAGRDIALLVIIDGAAPGWRVSARTILPALALWFAALPGIAYDEAFRRDPRVRWWELRDGMRRTARSLAARLAGRTAPPDPGAGGPEFPLAAVYVGALARFRPGRCEVPTLLVRSSAQPINRLVGDATLGWRALVGDDLTVRRVAGDHFGIMNEPGVRVLGAMLATALDRVQS